MAQILRKIALAFMFILSLPWLVACYDRSAEYIDDTRQKQVSTGISSSTERRTDEPLDVIARVGDQTISFREINTMINSAAIVGLSMPELGSPERDTVRITLLDKLISANLLYLDAQNKGIDQSDEYQESVNSFRDSILANLYRSKVLVGDIEVNDRDIKNFYNVNISEETELTDELAAGIEATIRKQRLKQRTATMRARLREGHVSVIRVSDLDPADDQVRSEDDVLAELDGVAITWAEVRPALQKSLTMQSVEARISALDNIIDTRLMAQKAKLAGLEQDPLYQARFNEFAKTRLINIHRGALIESWQPSDEAIDAFYDENRERIVTKEMRKVQMLVVNTEAEAEALKKKIEAYEVTFHKAVADHSIIADAEKHLGQIGWVAEGSGFPELDKETFMLTANEIGGPVQSPAGWHLVRILDKRDAVFTDINEAQTRNKTRRLMLDQKLAQYVVDLRKQHHTVEINETMISKLSQQEIDWYQEKLQKARKNPEDVIDQIKQLQKMGS